MNWLTRIKNKAIVTGDFEKDIKAFFTCYDYPHLYTHSINVAAEARKLANTFHYSIEEATIASYLHDVGAVIPVEHRIEAALEMEITVLPEEREFPMILHQKLSAMIAKEVFEVKSKEIIQAIECHTTLKKDCNGMDLVLFVADKMKWDQVGNPPYIAAMHNEIRISLEHAAFCYITYLWERRDQLKVLHPWLIDAFYDLKRKLK